MKRIFSLLLIPFLLTACDSWLDIVPEKDMATLDTEFETRSGADSWLQSCYVFLQEPLPSFVFNVAFTASDELVPCDVVQKTTIEGPEIASGSQNSLSPLDDKWSNTEIGQSGTGRTDFYTAINLCNIFIDKIDQVYNMKDDEKREWKAEVKAVKAYYYFELVRRYGPIILVPENIDPNVEVDAMKVARSHIDTCFQAIVDLCDEAAKDLPTFKQKQTNRRAYFCKEGALALKARARLYQASDLFNGNPDYADFKNKNGEPLFSNVKDKEKWKLAAEAAEEALQACAAGDKHLVDDQLGATELQTHMLNIEASTQTFNFSSPEALWMVKSGQPSFYAAILPKLKSDPNAGLQGSIFGVSLKMVEMFYTENGLPLDQDREFPSGSWYTMDKVTDPKYTDVVVLDEEVLRLHTGREPRFYASVAADRCYWRLGRTVDHLYKVEAYQGEEFGLKEERLNSEMRQNLSGYWMKKWSCSKAALFSYASDFAAMGESPFPVFRVAELYLIAAEAWNEYLDAPNDQVYDNIDVVRERAGIPKVRDAWANARDRSKPSTKTGMREIIRQEWNIEFAFEGMRFWNIRRWKTAYIEMNQNLFGWNVTGNTANSFYNSYKGPVVVHGKNKFVAPRDYFWPIRSEETLISGCVQNPGW